MEDKNISSQSSDEVDPSVQSSTNINTDISSHKSDTISTQNTMDKPCGCGKEGCSSCNSEGSKMLPRSYVYAIGKVVHRFPNRSLEMELAQAIGRRPEGETKGLTHPEVAHKVLTDPDNRYVARQICYILTIEGLNIYFGSK